MEKDKRLLVVHGYEVYPDGTLSQLCESVCREVRDVQSDYSKILFIAGQHLRGQPKMVSTLMAKRLRELGTPQDKLVDWYSYCPSQRPPRTTLEEVDLVPHLLRALGFEPRETPFDVACLDGYTPVVEFLYQSRGARVENIVEAPSLDGERNLIAQITLRVCRQWPNGDGPIFGLIKAKRNVFPFQFNGEPWNDNVPSAWD